MLLDSDQFWAHKYGGIGSFKLKGNLQTKYGATRHRKVKQKMSKESRRRNR